MSRIDDDDGEVEWTPVSPTAPSTSASASRRRQSPRTSPTGSFRSDKSNRLASRPALAGRASSLNQWMAEEGEDQDLAPSSETADSQNGALGEAFREESPDSRPFAPDVHRLEREEPKHDRIHVIQASPLQNERPGYARIPSQRHADALKKLETLQVELNEASKEFNPSPVESVKGLNIIMSERKGSLDSAMTMPPPLTREDSGLGSSAIPFQRSKTSSSSLVSLNKLPLPPKSSRRSSVSSQSSSSTHGHGKGVGPTFPAAESEIYIHKLPSSTSLASVESQDGVPSPSSGLINLAPPSRPTRSTRRPQSIISEGSFKDHSNLTSPLLTQADGAPLFAPDFTSEHDSEAFARFAIMQKLSEEDNEEAEPFLPRSYRAQGDSRPSSTPETSDSAEAQMDDIRRLSRSGSVISSENNFLSYYGAGPEGSQRSLASLASLVNSPVEASQLIDLVQAVTLSDPVPSTIDGETPNRSPRMEKSSVGSYSSRLGSSEGLDPIPETVTLPLDAALEGESSTPILGSWGDVSPHTLDVSVEEASGTKVGHRRNVSDMSEMTLRASSRQQSPLIGSYVADQNGGPFVTKEVFNGPSQSTHEPIPGEYRTASTTSLAAVSTTDSRNPSQLDFFESVSKPQGSESEGYWSRPSISTSNATSGTAESTSKSRGHHKDLGRRLSLSSVVSTTASDYESAESVPADSPLHSRRHVASGSRETDQYSTSIPAATRSNRSLLSIASQSTASAAPTSSAYAVSQDYLDHPRPRETAPRLDSLPSKTAYSTGPEAEARQAKKAETSIPSFRDSLSYKEVGAIPQRERRTQVWQQKRLELGKYQMRIHDWARHVDSLPPPQCPIPSSCTRELKGPPLRLLAYQIATQISDHQLKQRGGQPQPQGRGPPSRGAGRSGRYNEPQFSTQQPSPTRSATFDSINPLEQGAGRLKDTMTVGSSNSLYSLSKGSSQSSGSSKNFFSSLGRKSSGRREKR